jgi:hypothetical protein
MKLNKYLPFAWVYFFFNIVGLPFGLTWMAVLAPFFYVWIWLVRKKDVLLPFLAVLLPFIIMHVYVAGVDLKTYVISTIHLILVYLFCQAFYTFLKQCRDLEKIFRSILIINFGFCLAGIVFYFTPWYELFWIKQILTTGVEDFRRFKLFTYEASHYATLFTPVFFFFLVQYVLRLNTIRSIWLLPMLVLPYILSFSLGVIGAVLISCTLVLVAHFRRLIVKKRMVNAIINFAFVAGIVLTILVVYFRHNPLFIRLLNVFSGRDLSARGRTEDAFYLATALLEEKNPFWGIGAGQVKILGHDLIKGYYLYYQDFVAAIPNSMAETLAVFGWLGFFLKLGLVIFLYFFTKVWSNYFRMLCFFFIFIYQFTGSYITNLAEYVLWILAFTSVFRQFDVKNYRERALCMTAS